MRILRDPNPTDGGNPQSNVTPTAPSIPRTVSDKPGVGAVAAKPLPETSKGFMMKIDDPSLLEDHVAELKSDVVEIPKAQTPLDAAKLMIEEGNKETKVELKVEQKKEEVKPVIPTQQKIEETKKVETNEIKPIAPKQKGEVKEFDYTGFTQEEASALRQMSTTARDFTMKVLNERKELEKNKNGQYLQHPDAYVLDPQFSQLNEDVLYYNKEAQFWQEQVVKIGNGEKWTPLKAWDKQGNPILGPEQMPTPQAQEQARINMHRLINAAQSKEAELQNFASNYKNRIQQDNQAIQSERAKRFGWVADPRIMDSTLQIESGEEQSVKQVRDILINLFPAYRRNDVAVEVAADLFVAFQIQAEELRSLRAGTNVAQTQAKQVAMAEPTSTKGAAPANAGRTVNGVKEFSLAGLPT